MFLRHHVLLLLFLAFLPSPLHAKETMPATQPTFAQQWDLFQITLPGPSAGNPFQDVQLSARFTTADHSLTVDGFYDGAGIYRIRFMPPATGDWTYTTTSNTPALNGHTGQLRVTPPTGSNHGPVAVRNTYHFAYADGTRFIPIGTTCYSWTQQTDAIEQQTLATLAGSPFNKVRMLLLPVRAAPRGWPYPCDAAGHFDPTRFNPDFFQHLEQRIAQLNDLNVQADVILFHPYEKGAMSWFDNLDDADDERYLRYVVARLAAYRNVWWSLANEYGQVKNKSNSDFDRFFQLIQQTDPYNHLRSIHNAQRFYNANQPWVTHASIQNGMAVADFGRASLYRDIIPKPIVYDEICYEGDGPRRWGTLTGEQLVQRFWLATIAGTYAGHGETFRSPQGTSWTSTGGTLVGSSPPRIAFLKKILDAAPGDLEPIDQFYQTHFAGVPGQFYLVYFGPQSPASWTFSLPIDPPHKTALAPGMRFHTDLLDTWNMTITPLSRTFTLAQPKNNAYPAEGDATLPLPAHPNLALRLQRLP